MPRRCVKRALDQICAATNNTLKYKFVDYPEDANLVIGFDARAWLWYEYQRHSTSIVAEPALGENIDFVKMKVPLMATMHRRITESECQEFCLRELARALGYTWHPVSLERFTQDFRSEVAAVRKADRNPPATSSDDDGEPALSGPQRVRHYVAKAIRADKDNFFYYGGLAYLARGDVDMARRYFCNATMVLNEHPMSLRAVLNRFIGQGDAAGAELIAFACINDNEDNDPNNIQSKEYARVKKLNLSATARELPALSREDSQMLAKLYPSNSTAGGKEKPLVKASSREE